MQRDSRETRKWKRSKKILSLMCIVFLCLRRRSKRMSEIHCLQPNEYTAKPGEREKRREKRREGEKDFSLTNQFKPVDAKEKKERRILTHLCTSRQFPSPLTASRREKRERDSSFFSVFLSLLRLLAKRTFFFSFQTAHFSLLLCSQFCCW